MVKRLYALTAAAGLTVAGIVSIAALAAEMPPAGSVFGAGSVGAMHDETRGLATSAAGVRSEGGFATAGAVRWAATPGAERHADAYYSSGSVGAMVGSVIGLATNADAVRRQGGFATAGAVRWDAGPTIAAVVVPVASGAL